MQDQILICCKYKFLFGFYYIYIYIYIYFFFFGTMSITNILSTKNIVFHHSSYFIVNSSFIIDIQLNENCYLYLKVQILQAQRTIWKLTQASQQSTSYVTRNHELYNDIYSAKTPRRRALMLNCSMDESPVTEAPTLLVYISIHQAPAGLLKCALISR